jgi:conjugal transfer mating pair stabilization protein TraN
MYQNPVLYRAVIEFESAPSCYESDPGGGPLEGDICELGWTEEGVDEAVRSRPESIVPCLKDLKGESYCPEDLVACSKVREEDPGIRVEHTGVRTEEADCSEEDVCRCPSDAYVLDESAGTCRATYSYYTFECPAGRNLDDQAWAGPREPGEDCGGPLDCPYEPPPQDNCTRYRWVCPVSPELSRNCAWFGGEDWRCSSHICYNAHSGVDTDTPSGVNDKKDDGWQEDGECTGEIYIFNGEDMRCKHYDFTWGLVTMPVGWSMISWMLIDWDGCCTNDRSGLSLFPCKPEEKILQQKREKDLCVSVGEYCAQTLNLGFTEICLRKKKTFCCFSSKLARVVQEQARTQLFTLNTWGTPEGPLCRGFTPEEFQMIDWGKIDLSEFEAEIEEQTSEEVTDRMEEKLEGFYGDHF